MSCPTKDFLGLAEAEPVLPVFRSRRKTEPARGPDRLRVVCAQGHGAGVVGAAHLSGDWAESYLRANGPTLSAVTDRSALLAGALPAQSLVGRLLAATAAFLDDLGKGRRPALPLRILLDCDEVLLLWREGFEAYVETVLGLPLDRSLPPTFEMEGALRLLREDQRKGIFRNFALSPHFARLKPVPGAQEAIAALKAAGFELHVVTSCGDDPAVVRGRHANLDTVFGPGAFASVTCIGLGKSKIEAMAAHPPCIMVDDHMANLADALRIGHVPLLMSSPHNAEEDIQGSGGIQALRIHDWDHLQKMILMLKDLVPYLPPLAA